MEKRTPQPPTNMTTMDFEALLRKHQALLAENQALKEENQSLKTRLGLVGPLESQYTPEMAQEDGGQQDAGVRLLFRANIH
jgi:regulator of replication initiation timing